MDRVRRPDSRIARLPVDLLGVLLGFGVYDPDAKAWRQPLLEALITSQNNRLFVSSNLN